MVRSAILAGIVAGSLCAVYPASGQTPAIPRAYRGAQLQVDGIFVTPVPNAPFTAEVQIVSHDKLPDGTDHIVTTTNHIARSSSGRIRNERRQLVSPAFHGEPRLVSVHLYDPSNRMSIFYEPATLLARESILPAPPAPPAAQRAPAAITAPSASAVSAGTQTDTQPAIRPARSKLSWARKPWTAFRCRAGASPAPYLLRSAEPASL